MNQANYYGLLSSSSPLFVPVHQFQGYYYYQALRVTVRVNGTYMFISNSSIDMFGYLYNNSVDPSEPTQNMLMFNDDSAGGRQFRITVNLTSESSYVLIVTTFWPSTSGSFSITAFGPSSISLIDFTPSTSRPLATTSKRRTVAT